MLMLKCVEKDRQAREDKAFRLRLLAAEPELRRLLGRIPLYSRFGRFPHRLL